MGSNSQQTFEGVAYQPQEDVYFNDGREIALLHYVYSHPSLEEIRGNPDGVLRVIDEFGRKQKYLMNIGEYKARTVVELIKKEKPKIMVELGGYVGYSAIAFAAALREAGGKRYFSIEYNPEFGAVISSLVDLAGLGDLVTVAIGSSSDCLRRLQRDSTLQHIDLLFLDHLKPLYTTDLKLCEELHLVGPGSVYAADNVVKPGNPPYLEYVRSSVSQKKQSLSNHAGDGPAGRPELVYDSRFVEGWEPSGVPDALEITTCVGIEA